jgi:ABC-2 type transport system ATP-binding protein
MPTVISRWPATRTVSGPVVSFEGVTRRYGDVVAVRALTMQLRAGETVALLGPNGAGKTTALEMVLGMLTPDEGVIGLFGGPPAEAVASGRVGAMLQEGGLPKRVRVAELVGFVRGLYEDPLGVEDALHVCDIEDLADRRVERLSEGQRQRVRLALALAGRPDLLVLDEPTAAMDLAARRVFWDRMRAQVSEGHTVLFATHRLEEADEVADRVIVLAEGRVVADGAPGDVKAGAHDRGAVRFLANAPLDVLQALPGVEAVEITGGWVTLATVDPDRTVRALLEAIPSVEGLEIRRGRLEDAFLRLTGEGP